MQPPLPDLSFDRVQPSFDLPHWDNIDTHRRKAPKKNRIRVLSRSVSTLLTPLPLFVVVPPEQSSPMQDSLLLRNDWALLEEDLKKSWRILTDG